MTVETFLTALLGAAFAFLFFLAGEVFVKAYERSRAHFTAVVRIEANMNELLDEISILSKQVATYRSKIDIEDLREVVSRCHPRERRRR